MQGGCYWLADILHRRIQPSDIMINKAEEHCALYFAGGIYDVRGKISPNHYRTATGRDISYMKKQYIPGFEVGRVEEYLRERGLL